MNRVAAIGIATTLVVALASCGNPADPRTPSEQVADAVDEFADDNTGSYTLTVGVGDAAMAEEGLYRVTPDANATLRRFTSADGERVVRFLRLGPAVWLEQPGGPTGEARTGCWLHGTSDTVRQVGGGETGDVQLGTPAVEVVLGLLHGRRDGERLVADASLRDVAAALGFTAARGLDLPSTRVDVPVTVTVEESRITSWEVSLADLVAAAPAGGELGPADTSGSIAATFADPGAPVPLTPPDEANVVEAVVESDAPAVELVAMPGSCS